MGASLSNLTEGVGNGGSSAAMRPGLGDIPESCVACVFMYLTPPEICNLARLNRAFRGAASSDGVWDSKLPPTYQGLLGLLPGNEFPRSKKGIFALLSRPIPFDGGTKEWALEAGCSKPHPFFTLLPASGVEVWVDRLTSGVCMAISAKAMSITGIEDRRTLRGCSCIWVDATFREHLGDCVLSLLCVTRSLSFRLHLGKFLKRLGRRVCSYEHTHGWDLKPVRFQLSTSDGQQASCECCLDEPENDDVNANNKRGYWIEYKVGEFLVTDSEIEMEVRFSMKQIDCTHSKGGLCVDSVSIAPTDLRERRKRLSIKRNGSSKRTNLTASTDFRRAAMQQQTEHPSLLLRFFQWGRPIGRDKWHPFMAGIAFAAASPPNHEPLLCSFSQSHVYHPTSLRPSHVAGRRRTNTHLLASWLLASLEERLSLSLPLEESAPTQNTSTHLSFAAATAASMAPVLRFRRVCLEPARSSGGGAGALLDSSSGGGGGGKDEASAPPAAGDQGRNGGKNKGERSGKQWSYVDWCCWMIGYMFTAWWVLLILFNSLPAALPGYHFPEPPGSKLRREGLRPLHPVVLVPGIVTGGLELWEGRPCADGLFRKRLWAGSFNEIFKRPLCWLEHMSLDNETGLDPPGIRVRPVPGLVAADYFAPGYFVWAMLIENLARIGYEGKNIHMTAYDWRLSFQNTEVVNSLHLTLRLTDSFLVRDQALSRLKSKIELMVRTNNNKRVVVVPHSMGVLYFLHFLKWVEASPPMGGGGGPGWCAKHIKAVMNIGPTFLGVPKAVSGIISAEAKDFAFARAMAPHVLDYDILGLQTLEYALHVVRTWDSIMSLIPKGGETIWGNKDWSPEEGYSCEPVKKKYLTTSSKEFCPTNSSDGKQGVRVLETVHYGRLISFGKASSQLPSSELQTFNHKARTLEPLTIFHGFIAAATIERKTHDVMHLINAPLQQASDKVSQSLYGLKAWCPQMGGPELDHHSGSSVQLLDRFQSLKHVSMKTWLECRQYRAEPKTKSSCEEVWTEYDEMDQESIRAISDNKVYTAKTILDLLQSIAPKMKTRADTHFSHGIAENLDDPKYSHYKHWSNPLETKLPDAPDMEIYCLYGVGIPTERSYVYKQSSSDRCNSIPFQIDNSADESERGCLRTGVYFVDGDDTVPTLSAGFMCARGWRGRTRFNPSGMATYVREYRHKPPANLLEGRGLESGAHVDIMGNVGLIEDVMRVAAGATGTVLGGDRIYSDMLKIAERIKLRL
ncbi:hypothetical protein ACLOJK_030239 [Asimina triloba]